MVTAQRQNLVSFNYQFLDQDGNPIDLTGLTPYLLLYPPSGAATSIPASLVDASNGKVQCPNQPLATPGNNWEAQFFCTGGAAPLYGQRLVLPEVKANLDDLPARR